MKAEGEGRYMQQTGGRGQYGHAKIRLMPRQPGEGFVFENEIVGGTIPKEFIKPIEKGIKEALTTASWPASRWTTSRLELYDGRYHDVDSTEMAFKIAGSMAFKDAAKKASPVLLEPVMRSRWWCPRSTWATSSATSTSRRGHIEAHGRPRRHADHQRARAAVGDVRLRDRAALADPGPRHLLDALRSLRAGAEPRRRRSDRPHAGHQGE